MDIHQKSIVHVAVNGAECLKLLLMTGEDPNIPSEHRFDNYPIHTAVYENNVACLALLLQYHADLDVYNDYEETPLDIAMARGNSRCVDMLQRAITSVSTTSTTPTAVVLLSIAARGSLRDDVTRRQKLKRKEKRTTGDYCFTNLLATLL
jgi:ankyrin repeat protein